MTRNTRTEIPRRTILQAFLAVPAFALFRGLPVHPHDDIVEVNGWILKRSDLA